MVPARQSSNPTYPYRSNQEPRNSLPQTLAYNLFQPSRDPRAPQQETSMAPPFSLFPRDDVPQRTYDSPSVSRHEPALNSESFCVRPKLIDSAVTLHEPALNSESFHVRPKLVGSKAPDHPTPKQGTGRPLSTLAQELSQIRYGDPVSCAKLFMEKPEILGEDANGLLQETQRLQKEGRPQQVRALVHAIMLLRSCSKLSREGARAYLKRMSSGDQKAVRPFLEDVETVISALNARAAQTRGEETDPRTPIPANYPNSHPTVEGGHQGHSSAIEGYSTDLSRGGNIDQDLSSATQQLNIGGPTSTRRPRPVRRAIANTSETSPKRPPEDDPPFIGALSIEPDIRGSSGDHEELDPRYHRRVDAKSFFVPGRVFALLWHESAGDSKPGSMWSFGAHTTRGRFGETIFSHIRRMVVVKERHGYCVCIPINTYGGQGVLKHGLSSSERQAHAVIYSSNTSPEISRKEGELITKSPIAVDMASAEQKLNSMSRLNFGRPSTVEWNVKVMNIGMVNQKSMPLLMGYFRKEMNG
jgi:hypothetical protein